MAGLDGWSWFHDYSDPPKPPPCVSCRDVRSVPTLMLTLAVVRCMLLLTTELPAMNRQVATWCTARS